MGSSLGWTDEDRVPLCEAYLEVTGDEVNGTSRSKDELWEAVYKLWKTKLLKKGPLRVERNASGLEKQFKHIRAGVSAFTSHYLAVKNAPTTGNLSEEDIISGAVARFCSLDVYEAIRKHREADKEKGTTGKRKAKVAHCTWMTCWRVLRVSDKFSGAANSAGDVCADVDLEFPDYDNGSGSGSDRSQEANGFQRRSEGTNEAKARRLEDMKMEKQMETSTQALDWITDAHHKRTALCFFDSPTMRNTPEAAQYRGAVMRKMLARASVRQDSANGGASNNSEGAENGVGNASNGDATESQPTRPPAAANAATADAPPAGELPAADRTALAAQAAAQAARSRAPSASVAGGFRRSWPQACGHSRSARG